jgi:pilus assembly protein Flp/PilA
LRQILAALAARLSTGAAHTRGDDGATATEYAVLVGFIAVVLAAGIGIFGTQLNAGYESIVATLAGVL